MKVLALDIGDVWTGTALSDALGMFAKPLKTISSNDLESFLTGILDKEKISTIVVGMPVTMKGTQSEQTKKIIAQKEALEQEFRMVTWVLWDERLTSKRASSHKKNNSKDDKVASHSIAAAYILESYLTYKHTMENSNKD